ncbi:5'-cyclic-AMP and -GMP phosphodiesterase beta, partial [Durusdinium trenchii]
EPLKDLNPNLAGKLGVGKWNFDGLEAVQQHPSILRIVGTELLQHFSFVSRSALGIFLTKLEAAYNPEVPYHSNAHAADCANSFEVMLSNSGQDPHPLRIASCYIAALGHDMGHPGVNNAFMVNSRQDLALTYNDRSVLENYHAAELERLLVSRRVLALPKALEQKERQVRIAYILSTDMSKHMQDLGDFRLKLGCKDFDPLGNPADQQLSTMWLFRAADIAHSAKPWAIHRKWSMRVVQEFHEQGDRERILDLPLSPL